MNGATGKPRPWSLWRLSDTLFLRVTLLLLGNLILVQIVTYSVFRFEIDRPVISDRDIPERITSAILALDAAPPETRAVIAAALGTQKLQIECPSPATPLGQARADRGNLLVRVAFRLPAPWANRLAQSGGPDADIEEGEPSAVTLFAHLSDGTIAAFHVDFQLTARHNLRALIAILLVLVTISLVSLFFVRRLTQKLNAFAQAAESLGRSVHAPVLPETGPSELRRATHAFNVMQARLSRFITDRTQMLAAISHDLRTPLTRMRLRAEFVDDDTQRDKMLGDLAEMESMISATLAFARDDALRENRTPIDLSTLLKDLAETGAETGQAVTYHPHDPAPILASPLAIRRAVGNLVDNACKYGGSADIRLVGPEDGYYHILIRDQGPGIPEAALEQVFQPFFRLETSRNRDTGGVGLGLSVTRTIVRSHGGDVTLTNHPEGGLSADIALPA